MRAARRLFLFTATALAIAAAPAARAEVPAPATPRLPAVSVVEAARREIVERVVVTGTLVPRDEIWSARRSTATASSNCWWRRARASPRVRCSPASTAT